MSEERRDVVVSDGYDMRKTKGGVRRRRDRALLPA